MTAGRGVALGLRGAYGLFLLAAPQGLLALGPTSAVRRQPDWAPGILRVLGARHVGQALLLAARPQLAPLGSATDVAHAGTDLLCAVVVPSLRAPALLDTVVATGLAATWRSVARR